MEIAVQLAALMAGIILSMAAGIGTALVLMFFFDGVVEEEPWQRKATYWVLGIVAVSLFLLYLLSLWDNLFEFFFFSPFIGAYASVFYIPTAAKRLEENRQSVGVEGSKG
jgi:hypothetical protein